MLRLLIPAVLSATPFLFLPNSSLAQNPMPSNNSCPCILRGSVVDSVSGQPVPHALVKLTAPSPRAALTDSEGKFQFEGLPAGSATLEAEKPGYLSRDSMGPHLSVPVSVKLASDAPPAILKLVPEGVISGQVTDERGEPLEGFTVMIWTRSFDTGIGEVGFNSSFRARTDDEGKFRIARLSPGSYFLLAQPPQGAVQEASFKSSVPSGYAPVFYSGANDLQSANPVRVLPGKSTQANFSLKREPFIRLSGTVSGYNAGDQVNLTLRAGPGIPDPRVAFEAGNGSFHTDWVPPGLYTLLAEAVGGAPSEVSPVSSASAPVLERVRLDGLSPHSFASQQINASSTTSDLRLVLQPTVDIPLIVHGLPASDSSVRPDFFPQFFPRLFALIPRYHGASGPAYFPDWENREDARPSSDLRLRFTGVRPGTYELMIGLAPNSSFYVESASSGSVNLLRENLVLSGSIPPIDVVLRDDPATLSGTISSGSTPVQGVVIALSDSRSKPITFATGLTGAYKISGLAPGAYRVFAVVPAMNPDYLDPAFQQKISSKIQEITLNAKQTASLNLELAAVEE